ncbi:PHA/PHB synthase family protein [Methylovirgula sp. 4M-Z18]|uniref:PHA/PHB synthase family protein n=1 Tax=Methylovirgula sp. 4M-Z18 TaxID=2293567 RepID=UPI0018F6F51B|nr:alpha/beta hydrolase [Methylovirgula sp. 4M-Z18]
MSSDKHTQAPKTDKDDQTLADQVTDNLLGPNPFIGLRPQDIMASFQVLAKEALRNPMLVVEQEAALVRDLVAVIAGQSELAPSKGDKRFNDEAWMQNPLYRTMLQGYVAWTNALQGFVERTDLDDRTKERARFAVSLFADAFAPTNAILTNPAALRKTVATKGQNVLDGLKNFVDDIRNNGGLPSQVNREAFTVGENLALSAGKVVFRNPLLELIQYAPTTDTVFERPHLIIPPEINKFYVFDLAPGRSIVEYLVKHGLQIFVVSWRNPSEAQSHWGIDAYVAALDEAIAAMRDITGSNDFIIHAACSGAMTAAALAAHYANTGDTGIQAMTMMVAVLGQIRDGTLALFATDETAGAAKLASQTKGILDGTEMNRIFAWLRPNDLVWNFWVNNYLMGNPPPAFDILYWSNDSTRLPAKFHAELIDIFRDNRLIHPGAMKVLGKPIDLSKLSFDKMFVAGTTDHITPWKGVYQSARSFGGKNDFILSNSGHIQSLINPPTNAKAKFFLNPALPASPDDWLREATPTSGSWWDLWRNWSIDHSGGQRSAPKTLGSEAHPPLGDAPGTYVVEA